MPIKYVLKAILALNTLPYNLQHHYRWFLDYLFTF